MEIDEGLLRKYIDGDLTLDQYIEQSKQKLRKGKKEEEPSPTSLISGESVDLLRIKWAADLIREL